MKRVGIVLTFLIILSLLVLTSYSITLDKNGSIIKLTSTTVEAADIMPPCPSCHYSPVTVLKITYYPRSICYSCKCPKCGKRFTFCAS